MTRKSDIKAFNENVGWWFSIKSADMDGDGDQDIIAGNLGKNYKYKATLKEPFEVYYYDFDDNSPQVLKKSMIFSQISWICV